MFLDLCERMWGRFRRQTIVAVTIPLLAACGTDSKPLGVVGHITQSFGGAVADEPAAALVARDTLSAGGNAADAAVALYFALSATYPSAAGIGGGGICVVYRAAANESATIDFRARGTSARNGFDVAPPGNARGMAALHARFGRLPWQQLVQPGERLARFGNRISRALARAIAANAERLRGDERARALFFRPDGTPLREGDRLEQVELATVLGQLRFKGAGALHGGPLARRYAEAARAIGGRLSVETLRDATPALGKPAQFSLGDHTVNTVPSTSAAGLWQSLFVNGAYRNAPDGKKAAAIAAAQMSVGGNAPGAAGVAPDRSGTTGFAVIDRAGGVVACSLSMNGPFGTGRMLPGTGVFAVAAASEAATDSASVAIVNNENTGNTFFAAAASGGPASAAALARVAGGVLIDGDPLADALAQRRQVADRASRIVYAEPGSSDPAVAPLRDRGLRIVTRGPLGRVNAIHCARGNLRDQEACRYGVDPRGFGHAVNAGQ